LFVFVIIINLKNPQYLLVLIGGKCSARLSFSKNQSGLFSRYTSQNTLRFIYRVL